MDQGYDQKRLRADEQLFIKKDYSVFPEKVKEILNNEGLLFEQKDGWQQALRRAYIFLNCEQKEENIHNLKQDVFSTWFTRYLEMRNGSKPSIKEKDLISDAFKMLFLGSLTEDSEIPVTMRREGNSSQCVQIVYGNIKKTHFV